MSKKVYLIIIFVLIQYCGYSQRVLFDLVSEEDGLTSNSVYEIDEDKNGYLWIVGLGGVARFDGKKARTYTTQDGWPVESNISRLLIDKNDVLWVGPRDTCMFLVENMNSNNPKIHLMREVKSVISFKEEENGLVWIGTYQHLYLSKNYQIIKDIPFKGGILDIESTKEEIYLASQDSGVYVYHKKTERITRITKSNGILSNHCWSIGKVDDDLYIGHENGITILRKDGFLRTDIWEYPSKVVRISIDAAKRVWISSESGIKIYYKRTPIYDLSRRNNSMPGAFYESIFFDKEGNNWFCNTGGGVLKIKNLQMLNFQGNIEQDEPTYGLVQQNDSTYFTSSYKGPFITKMTIKENIAKYDTISTPGVIPIFGTKDPINNISVLSGQNGIVFVDEKGVKIEKDINKLSNFFLLQPYFNPYDSAIYIGSMDGITKYKNGKFDKIYYFKNGIHTIIYTYEFAFSKEHIFVSTGLGLKEVKNNSIIDVDKIDELMGPDLQVYNIIKDANQQFWTCINHDIMLRFWVENGNIKYKEYNMYKLFGVKGPFSFFTYQNTFWLRTMEKIYQVNLPSLYKEAIIIENVLDQNDGINKQSTYYTKFLIDSNHQLWILSDSKLLRFNWKNYTKNQIEPKNSILKISLPYETDYSQFTNQTQHINGLYTNPQIPNKLNEISFDFIGICHTSQKEVKYKTRLIGLNDNWSQPSYQSSITYNNLSPGSYTFQFISCNNDGLWNTEPYSYTFTILPAWYQTWWFRLLMAVVLAALIYLLFLLRINKLKKDKKRQEKLTQDILQSQEQERKRIAQDLHDGIGQELSMLKVNVEKIKNEPILHKVNKIIEDIRFLSRNIHPHYFEKLGLTKAITMIVEETSKLGKIYWAHEIENIDEYLSNDKQLMLFRVIQECMNNTIKHSGAKNAKVTIGKNENNLTILVQDNGVGFNVSSEKLNSLGLSTIRERVKALNGTVTIKSQPGHGSQTEIVIPINKG